MMLEETLIKKYPELFKKTESGEILPSTYGINIPEEWNEVVDDLCGCIVSYIKNTKVSEKNKDKLTTFKFFVWRSIILPINRYILKFLNPYKKFDGFLYITEKDRYKIETSKIYKVRQKINSITFNKLRPENVFICKPPCEEFVILQIKCKFDELRVYVNGADDRIYGMIRFAEYLCKKIQYAKSNIS
jgi:hypothetical protein